MTATIPSAQLTSLNPDETLSEYVEKLPRDPISLKSITQYLNFIDEYKNSGKSQIELVIPPELIFDPELQLLYLLIQSFQLYPALIAAISQVFITF